MGSGGREGLRAMAATSFWLLWFRHERWLLLDPRIGARGGRLRRLTGTAMPTRWPFVLSMSVLLPLMRA